jgi:ribosome-binding ATPase YchF (GTP1/OBG family)
VKKRRERHRKDAKRGDKEASPRTRCWQKFEPVLDAGKPAFSSTHAGRKGDFQGVLPADGQADDFRVQREGGELAQGDKNPYVQKVQEYVKTHLACEAVVISAQIESDLIDLTPKKRGVSARNLGVEESGIGALIRATYHLLGLRTYFTAGEKEVRAWTIHAGDTAPKAAGVIHSDFERGFIKAETVAYDDLIKCGSVAAAREKGLYRMEGKEYVVKDGDVMLFKFNVCGGYFRAASNAPKRRGWESMRPGQRV